MTELPAGWIAAKLEDICESITDGDHLPPPQVETGVPFLVIGDVRSGTISFDDCRRVPEDYFASLASSRKPRRGDLLYTVTGSFGIPVIVTTDQPFCVQRHIAILRPAPETDVRYMRHALATSTSFAQAAAIATGTAQKTVPLRGLRRLAIPLAPSHQQHHIVAAIESNFSRLDAATATLERVQRNLERYRASVLKAAVEGRLVPTEAELAKKEGRSYEPAAVLLKRILAERRRRWEEAELAKLKAKGKPPTNDRWKARYEEPVRPVLDGLPQLPEGWGWASPAQLASPEPYSLGIGPFGSNLKVSDYRDSGVPLIFVRSIRAESYEGPHNRFVSPEKAGDLVPHAVQPGDLLVTKMGDPPGDSSIYPLTAAPAILTADCIKWRPAEQLQARAFLLCALRSSLVRGQVLGITKGVAQKKISLERFSTVAIPLPPASEQVRIAAACDSAMLTLASAASDVAKGATRIGRLRQSILKWAFEGRLGHSDGDASDNAMALG